MPKTCSIDGLQRLRDKHPEGMVAIITMKGCAPCGPAKRSLKKAVGKKAAIVEIPAEDAACDKLLSKLHVDSSPVVFWMKGKKMKRISDDGKGDEEVAKEVKALIGAGKK